MRVRRDRTGPTRRGRRPSRGGLAALAAAVLAAALAPGAAAARPAAAGTAAAGAQAAGAPAVVASVYRGRALQAGELGYLVAVLDAGQLADAGDVESAQFCGGSLVAARTVVTAAHCVVDERGRVTRPAALRVLVGSKNLEDPRARLVAVSAVRPHPRYDERTSVGDVAVLTLAAPVTGVPTVAVANRRSPAALRTAGRAVRSGGWGIIDADQDWSAVARAADLTLFSTAQCASDGSFVYRGVAFLGWGDQFDPEVMLCAMGVSGRKVVDTCSGDSGGPLVLRYGSVDVLVGVVSFGGEKCGGRQVGVYSRVEQLDAFAPVRAAPAPPPAPRVSVGATYTAATVGATPADGGSPVAAYTLTWRALDGSATATCRLARPGTCRLPRSTAPAVVTATATTAAGTSAASSAAAVPAA